MDLLYVVAGAVAVVAEAVAVVVRVYLCVKVCKIDSRIFSVQ